jgi:BirA family transcriptional regulator, biotin operon repressor / biotin---[acetyl-CoA-carboxylase] ligase
LYNIPASTLFIGKHLIHLPSCDSTNAVAHELLNAGKASDGSLIITSEQTAGKGQRGNSWEAEPGKNLTFSVIIKPRIPIGEQFQLNIISSLAIYSLLTKYLGNKVKIKWPNDIYYEDRKICGMLIQNFIKGPGIENSIIGIGLNVNQTKFEERKAISMAMVCGQQFSLQSVLDDLLEQLEHYLGQLRLNYLKELKKQYLSQLYWFHEQHLFKSDHLFKGIIIGINDSGFLHMKTDEGEKYFNFKEVVFVE